jgi:stage II sporulation protein GA (sporulation sigma-E factor processing peptidase)
VDQDYIIYLDVVFGINFLMDYGILWATAKLGQLETSWRRLALAAALGSFYSLAVFIPNVHWLFFYGIKFIFSIVMIVTAFSLPSLKKIIKAIGYFYMVAFSAAGAMFGAVYFFDNTPGAYTVMNGALLTFNRVGGSWLLWAMGVLLFLGRYGASYLKRGFLASYSNIPVVIRIKNQSIPVKALIDTGNRLKDPLTHKPVMIIEYSLVKTILPFALQDIYDRGETPNFEQIIQHMGDGWWARRLRIVPFQSIETSNGLMLAFRPDIVYVKIEEKLIRVEDVVIGISKKNLTQSGNYRALLHAEMLQEAISA